MDEPSQDFEPKGSIRSLSLQDLVNARPPFLGRIAEIAKTALMIWGAISLSAAAGYAALQFQGGSEQPVLRSERQAIERSVRAETAKPSSVAKPAELRAAVAVAPDPSDTTVAEEIAAARVPRPRPDEPVITGSVARMAADPYARDYQRERYADPCEAWNSLGMPFRVRCVRETRRAPIYYPAYRDGW